MGRWGCTRGAPCGDCAAVVGKQLLCRQSHQMSFASPDRDEVILTAEPLPLGYLAPRVVCPTAGAIATFIGTTRDHFEGMRVIKLEVRAVVCGGR